MLYFSTNLFAGVPVLEWVAYSHVSAEGYCTHVHDAGRARQNVTAHVDIAPHQAERPVP